MFKEHFGAAEDLLILNKYLVTEFTRLGKFGLV